MELIVVKHTADRQEEHKEEKALYEKYIEKNGHHFTSELAIEACKWMVNADGSSHLWSIKQIEGVINSRNAQFKHRATTGDIAYAANMYYSDFYPAVITTEMACVDAAFAIANDPDGYEGQIFDRWMSDIKAENINIDWTKYL